MVGWLWDWKWWADCETGNGGLIVRLEMVDWLWDCRNGGLNVRLETVGWLWDWKWWADCETGNGGLIVRLEMVGWLWDCRNGGLIVRLEMVDWLWDWKWWADCETVEMVGWLWDWKWWTDCETGNGGLIVRLWKWWADCETVEMVGWLWDWKRCADCETGNGGLIVVYLVSMSLEWVIECGVCSDNWTTARVTSPSPGCAQPAPPRQIIPHSTGQVSNRGKGWLSLWAPCPMFAFHTFQEWMSGGSTVRQGWSQLRRK